MQRTKKQPARYTHLTSTKKSEATEKKDNLLIRYLWQNGTESFHNMRVVNTDAKYHLAKTPEKCLQEAERAKKKMYLEDCL